MPVVTLSGVVKKGSVRRGTYKTREGVDVASLQFRVVQDGEQRTSLVEASGERSERFASLKDGDTVEIQALVWLVEPQGKPAFVKYIVVDGTGKK